MKKIKILFVIHQLNLGGSQRVLINIMNAIDREKYDIHLAIFKNIGELKNNLQKDIIVHDLNVDHVRSGILKLYKLIKEENPDILFSGIAHVNSMISILIPFLPKNIKYIARETSIPSLRQNDSKMMPLIYKYCYKNFDTIIAQSFFMKEDLIKNYKISDSKIKVINNPVDIEKIQKLSNIELNYYSNDKVNLLAVGRLNKVKRFDVLIDVMNTLDNKFFLTIIGSGEEKNALIEKIKKFKLESRVKVLDFQSNPYNYMKKADLLLLASEYEGFPNVVLEANTCGIPVVAFECPGVSDEIIINGLNGFLVECGNIDKLTLKIQEAVNYKWQKDKIQNYIKERFNIDYIIEEYKRILS